MWQNYSVRRLNLATPTFASVCCMSPFVSGFIMMLKLTGSSVATSTNASCDGMSGVMNGSDLKPTVLLAGTSRFEHVASSSIGRMRYLLPSLSMLRMLT